MVSYAGLTAWVETRVSDGEWLRSEEYRPILNLKEKTTSVFIESHEGRQFRIRWRDERPDREWRKRMEMFGMLRIDGTQLDCDLAEGDSKIDRICTLDGLPGAEGQLMPFHFSKVLAVNLTHISQCGPLHNARGSTLPEQSEQNHLEP